MKVYVAEKPKLGKAMVQVLSKTSPITNRGDFRGRKWLGGLLGCGAHFCARRTRLLHRGCFPRRPEG